MSETNPVLDFLDDDALHTPPVASAAHPEGKVYRIASPSAEAGLFLTNLSAYLAQRARDPEGAPDERQERRIQAFLDKHTADVDEDDDEAMQMEASGRLVMGDTVREMLDDGVSWVRIQRLTRFAMIHFTQGPEAAIQAALAGVISGGAPHPANRAERRAKGKAGKGKGKR